MEILKPARLRKGDTICIIAPSGRINHVFPQRINRAKAYFEGSGYKVKIIFNKNLGSDFQQSVLQRAEEVHEAFKDPAVKAIVSAIGGLSVNEILPYLDYALIRQHPKIVCGYSDITLLHQALYTQAGLATFYGPAAITQWGEFPEPLTFTSSAFFDAITKPEALGQLPRSVEWTDEFLDWGDPEADKRGRQLRKSDGWRWLRPGKAQGRLMGGCLPSCAQLFGTKYQPDYKGTILFLELPDAPPEPHGSMSPAYARSCLADYALAGILDEVVGIVFGRPLRLSAAETSEFEHDLLNQCRHSSYPILVNIDLGHTDPILTLPYGALAELDSEADTFSVLEGAVI